MLYKDCKVTVMEPFEPVEEEKRVLTEDEIVAIATEKARAKFREVVAELFEENERLEKEN